MAVGLDDVKRIHLIGVGGCSMSGIAQILKKQGHVVTGSDRERSQFTDRLEELGIPVSIPQKGEQVEGAELVIYSAAIKPDNPERAYAREHGIPEMERSVALGQISARYPHVAAISGCHGKTTITSMLAYINEEAQLDATVHVGGFVDLLNGGVKVGDGDLFITEACEYVRSFLTLVPTVALVNNIDNDHLDYFKTFDNIVNAFRRFVAKMPEGGLFIGCTDDQHVRKLLDEFSGRTITYGTRTFSPDYYPENIEYDEFGCASFDVMYRGEELGRIVLHVPGKYNMMNALAACVVALAHGDDFETIAKALSEFHSVARRFELYGERNGVRVFHDYAHHPAEIRAALDSGMRTKHNRMFVVFQCNSYTRAKTLFTGYVDCFKGADEVLVPDIYPGREIDDGSVHAVDMVEGINRATENAKYIPTFEEINDYLLENAHEGDIVITLGSGDVYKKTRLFLK